MATVSVAKTGIHLYEYNNHTSYLRDIILHFLKKQTSRLFSEQFYKIFTFSTQSAKIEEGFDDDQDVPSGNGETYIYIQKKGES